MEPASPPVDGLTKTARPRRLRLTLRGSMLLVLCLGLWLGWRVHLVRQQREAVAAVKAHGGFVRYDWEVVGGKPVAGAKPRGPGWLRRAIGDDYFQHIVEIDLSYGGDPRNRAVETPLTAEGLAAILASCPSLRRLWIPGHLATNRVMATVGGLKSLESLEIWGPGVTEGGMARLRGLRNLKTLQGYEAGLGDDGLAHLEPLATLESLDLAGNPLTDAGLPHLKGLRNLRFLGIHRTKVTDAGLGELCGLAALKEMWVSGSAITDEGVMRFQEGMPNLGIIR